MLTWHFLDLKSLVVWEKGCAAIAPLVTPYSLQVIFPDVRRLAMLVWQAVRVPDQHRLLGR